MKVWSVAPRLIERLFRGTHSQCSRRISLTSSLPQYAITTPIFYVNAVPHIGHLYSALLADYAHRYRRLKGDSDGIFSTGTDEHGLKIQNAAAAAGKSHLTFCDEVSEEFRNLFDTCDVAYTDFIRTTEQRHKMAVNHFWERLHCKGWITEGRYEGWYSVPDETFLPESQVTEAVDKQGEKIKISAESGHPVEWTTETNYLFKLSHFQDQLIQWLDANPKAVQPSKFHAMVRSSVASGLKDLSVSRQRDRLECGIPVPGDDTQTIYVWLDALVNYLTVCGYPGKLHGWPGVNIVGKDILRFHAIYWPAFLMAADLDPPESIVCHSHWTVDSHKMSKSRGNVVDPNNQIERFTSDGLRYFLLRVGVPHSDCDYSEHKVASLLNEDLANTLGNLLSRVTGQALNPQQLFPPFHEEIFPLDGSIPTSFSMATDSDYELLETLRNLPELVDSRYESFRAYSALEEIMACLRQANSFIERHKPWQLAKDPEDQHKLDNVIYVVMETLRICGILLQPIVPRIAERLLDRLGVDSEGRSVAAANLEAFTQQEHGLGSDKRTLFNKVEVPKR